MSTKMEEVALFGDPKYTALRRSVDILKPGPNEVLIKVVATGLNPKDWKVRQPSNQRTGDSQRHSLVSVWIEYRAGDRVAAFHQLTEPYGGYTEYAIALASSTFHLPPNVSFEEGAGLPLVTMTAGISLYQALQLPLPTSSAAAPRGGPPILIYGGSTAVGSTLSSLNAATHIIDYRDGDVAEKIIEVMRGTGKELHHVLDAVSEFGSHKMLTQVLVAFGGGEINMLDPAAESDAAWQWPEGVKFSLTFVPSSYGRKHPWITEERAAADKDFGHWFYRYISYLLAKGDLSVHPHEILPKGLDGILEGVQRLRNNEVSAKKLVAWIADTPGL
ncbi:hypothetical protein BGZ63DRAFT_414758 [Mariannaea sp. PMI_226]|nr:hypothetical protein BGZ63DRAFT_414758 [Mariannaea sp. PMI_226]